MRIKFTGYMNVAEMPDDAGSIDHWLVQFLTDAVDVGPETDDVISQLQLRWEVE